MRILLACLALLQGIQSPLAASVGGDADLLREVRQALARSPPKTPLTRRHIVSEDATQDIWPRGVLLGAGVLAAQSEGAWNESGKGESILDVAQHIQGSGQQETMEVAANHYHRFREDLDLAKQMKFTSHRFSISWSRVLPTGGTDNVNEEGVQFYRDYIDKVISNGMEPLVTMIHMDQPFAVENATHGWEHPAMIEKFVAYAEFLFETFGSKVKYWNTLNEPNMYCNYWPGFFPKPANAFHLCMHNMILAHMQTYQVYKQKYEPTQKGKVGSSAIMLPAMPKTTQSEDVMAAETFNQVYTGTVLHPLVFGDYPPVLYYLTDKLAEKKNFSGPYLPRFTDEQKAILAGGVTDFVALNLYSECTASYNPYGNATSDNILLKSVMEEIPFVKISGMGDFSEVDESLMKNGLLWIWSTYHVPIIIAENGFADIKHVGINDTERAAYHSANLRSLVQTIKEFGVEVLAYYVWCLLDVFEFSAGYSGRPFGLIHVDYKTGSLNRTLKNSAQFFIELSDTGRVPYVPVPDDGEASASATSTISTGLLLAAVWAVRALRP